MPDKRAWSALPLPAFTQDRLDRIEASGLHVELPIQDVAGRWVRAGITLPREAPDALVWIIALDDRGRPLQRQVPTHCTASTESKQCRNYAWMPPEADSYWARVYVAEEGPWDATLSIDVAEPTKPRAAEVARLDAMLGKLSSLYFRTDEVDWRAARERALDAMGAPIDTDPLPSAALRVLGVLPDATHMGLMPHTSLEGPTTTMSTTALPTCACRSGGRRRLDLPSTPLSSAGASRYLEAVRRCLEEHPDDQWLLNLTDNAGGDAALLVAAVAPWLQEGTQFGFRPAADADLWVALGSEQVTVGEARRHPRSSHLRANTRSLEVLIGPRCGSACEMLAVALNGRSPLLGQATMGLTTANELIDLSSSVQMTVTSGLLIDREGEVVNRVHPEFALEPSALADRLRCES